MTRCEEICKAAPECTPCRCEVGERVIGAMDGWTITVPALDAELERVDRTQRREPAED